MIKLLDKISPLPHNVYDFKLLEEVKADIITSSAARIDYKIGNKFHFHWTPLSALAKDKNNNIWIKKWFYEQKVEKKN
jgi:hypothetical protein